MDQSVLNCFLHLPRTGGTTFTHTLAKALGKEKVYHVSGNNSLEVFTSLSGKEQQRILFICGHIPYGIHCLVDRPVNYFTILRDPVERLLSDYAFIRKNPDHYLYPAVSRMDLRQYLLSGVNPVGVANPQVVRLQEIDFNSKGGWFKVRPALPDEQMLATARERVFRKMYMVGLTEHLPLFMDMVGKYLGVKLDLKARLNASRSKPVSADLPAADLGLIEEMNHLDIVLYNEVASA
jgi:hypothetical protein